MEYDGKDYESMLFPMLWTYSAFINKGRMMCPQFMQVPPPLLPSADQNHGPVWRSCIDPGRKSGANARLTCGWEFAGSWLSWLRFMASMIRPEHPPSALAIINPLDTMCTRAIFAIFIPKPRSMGSGSYDGVARDEARLLGWARAARPMPLRT